MSLFFYVSKDDPISLIACTVHLSKGQRCGVRCVRDWKPGFAGVLSCTTATRIGRHELLRCAQRVVDHVSHSFKQAAKGPGNSRWGLFQLVRQAVSQVNRLMLKNARQLDLVLPQHVSQSVPIGIESFHLTTGQV